jgi:hypothetical protein
LVCVAALALYLRTGAPTLLTGDQAEHQMAAAIAGVPHATGYPLFTMLNTQAVRLLPFSDAARRVTAMAGVWAALAVALAFVLAAEISGSWLGGLVAAVTLATAPRFWALATVAEVYTLQALLVLTIWWFLRRWWHAPADPGALCGATLCAGMAVTHHGSFVPIALPAIVLAVTPLLWRVVRQNPAQRWRSHLAWPAAWGLAGLTPWLYLAAQFALFRPFDYYRGQGAAYHYYWGNPASWGDVVNLALGAGFRGKILVYGWQNPAGLARAFARSLRLELGLVGVLLAGAGLLALALRERRGALFSAALFVCAALFGLTIAGDVPKAPVYSLPAYVVASVWAGIGAAWLAAQLQRRLDAADAARIAAVARVAVLIMALGLAGWRAARLLPGMDRSADDGPRRFAEGVLAEVEPDAAILCRWEQCLALQYLQLAEHRRLDVVLDQTEPEDGVSWADRATLYQATRPVYAIGFNQQLAERYPVYPLSETFDLW